MMRHIALSTLGLIAVSLLGSSEAQAASTPPPPVSGCLNQTLSDGFWSLKVTNVVLGMEPSYSIPAYGATFTVANVASKAASPQELGMGDPQIVIKDGTTLDLSTDSGIAYERSVTFANFTAGMQATGTYWFRTDDVTNRAITFVLPVSATNSVYGTSLGYKLRNPSFSVDLTCDKSASPKP